MSRRPPKGSKPGPEQLELPFGPPRVAPVKGQGRRPGATGLRLIQGGGESKQERLESRESVVRVLLEAGVDLLLRRISAERAEEIESRVDRLLTLFDGAESEDNRSQLRTELDELERLMTETRGLRPPRRRSV